MGSSQGSSPHQQAFEPAGISSSSSCKGQQLNRTQQTQGGSDLINSILQLFRICSKNLGDSLSFVRVSSLDNKWEQYFIYAQVINSNAEEADERRAISIKKVMD